MKHQQLNIKCIRLYCCKRLTHFLDGDRHPPGQPRILSSAEIVPKLAFLPGCLNTGLDGRVRQDLPPEEDLTSLGLEELQLVGDFLH